MKSSLNKAIKLHQKHMDEPSTTTMKSQNDMMGLMKKHKNKEMPKKCRQG